LAVNRVEQCNNNVGGASELYVFAYKNYSRSKISVVDNILVEFPYSVIHDINANEISFTENIDEEDGGVTYSQSGNFQLKKTLPTDSYKSFASIDWRVIVKDNNGYYRMIGLETGVKLKFTKEIGTNLADFNGFKFTFETKEENTAPFINDLSGFAINTNPLWVDLNSNFIVDTNDNKIEVII